MVRTSRFLASTVLPLLVASAVARPTGGAPSGSASLSTTLYAATTDDEIVGSAVEVLGGPPWQVTPVAPTQGGRMLRQFGKFLYVVNTTAGTILRVKRDGTFAQVINLGSTSEPQDVLVVKDSLAYVTRKNHTHLRRIDLLTGAQSDVVDLGVLAAGGETLSLRTLQRDGNRLLVQVQLNALGSFAPQISRGVLGVVDLTTETLIDVDPAQSGVQGVALAGAPPQHKMQIVERMLFVSTTDGRLDNRGGIEMVDLDTLASVGYALTEEHVSADLGGFVMTSACGGFFVFHTDIVASTHLKPFTISGGAPPGPEILVLLGDTVDVIGYDAYAKRIFLPSGFAGFGATSGIYVFDSLTHQQIGTGPIDTGYKPHDLVIVN